MTTTPTADVKPKVPQTPRKRLYLRPDEANRLIAAAGKRGRYPFRDKVLVRLIYRHGLRVSEATNLRWANLDLDAGTVHIMRLKGSKDSTHTFDRDELRDLRLLRKTASGPFVFETERGGPLSADAVQYIVREAGKLAKLDLDSPIHPHMLRHAAGYALANDGTDTRLIQDFLGHRDIRHTAHYTEIAPKRLASLRIR